MMKKILLTTLIAVLLIATAILPLIAAPTSAIADTSIDEQVGAGNCDAFESALGADFTSISDFLSMNSNTAINSRYNSGFVFTTVAIPNSCLLYTSPSPRDRS